ncbi:Uncharacterised protein [uncultured archaeon]|nr:Uncharacterised protein [uncultured archaeon]
MEKEIGRIKKNETTDIIVRVDEYKGKKGLTIREFVTSERYTGFTKAGTRIGPEDFLKFREMINSIDINEIMSPAEKPAKAAKSATSEAKPKKDKKPKVEETEEETEDEDVDESELAEE